MGMWCSTNLEYWHICCSRMTLRKVLIMGRIWDIMQQQYLSALQKTILLLNQVGLEKVTAPRESRDTLFLFSSGNRRTAVYELASVSQVVNTQDQSRRCLINFPLNTVFQKGGCYSTKKVRILH